MRVLIWVSRVLERRPSEDVCRACGQCFNISIL